MNKRLARLIVDARRDAELTQDALAARAGTSQSAIARYESGAVTPSFATLTRLLSACGRLLDISAVATGRAGEDVGGPDLKLLRDHRQELLALAARHGARNLRLFGSLSRGEQRPDSDVDLLVDLDEGRTLLDLVAFRRSANEVLGVPVDAATPDMLKDAIREDVLSQARTL
ncbi:MAG: nucleotidyltransferase domain-containing protein [Solirubrobacteraceae bacterium]